MGFPAKAGLSELADEADSKSVDGNIVWVQVPWPALKSAIHLSGCVAFVILPGLAFCHSEERSDDADHIMK